MVSHPEGQGISGGELMKGIATIQRVNGDKFTYAGEDGWVWDTTDAGVTFLNRGKNLLVFNPWSAVAVFTVEGYE
jgi:hypothetical protein